ncbi:cysteinyl-tRNA synthetase [Entomophthora muscae]|uniref:Cysteinyl-tRNA synthetase n=1 Tax=Entomophthora muscae TaxID=34485 RepID=A0ACC2TSN0_9FUNG|nr:cysteinyl-tRNA synthetase [Entomophthora muscae]
MKFPFGRRKPKEKSTDTIDLNSTVDGRANKSLSYCSDTEAEREFRPSSGLVIEVKKHRRRGSDADYSAGPDGSLSPTAADVHSKYETELRRDEALDLLSGGATHSAPHRKSSAESIRGPRRNGVLVSPTTSLAVAAEMVAVPEYNITDYDRGWLTEDTLYDCDSDDRHQYRLRIFRPDSSFSTISCPLRIKAFELCSLLGRKFFLSDVSQYSLYLQRQNVERVLADDERPLVILKRLLEKIGYLAVDGLPNLGREDNSYYFRFLFDLSREHSVDKVSELPSATHVDLRSNNLRKLPAVLIRHADRVQALDLSNNLMIESASDFFGGCVLLRELRLSRCELHAIPDCVKVLPALEALDLSSNRIKTIGNTKIEGLRRLKTLMLGNNRIEVLPLHFAELSMLTSLNLSNNRFSLFPVAICQLVQLVHLDISFNEIRHLPPSIGQLKHLRQLLLISNRIAGALPPAMLHLTQLRELDLRKNQINNLDVLHSLPNLEFLLCDYNSLSSLALNFQYLRDLHISKNSITQLLPPQSALPSLATLNLSFSKLVSLPEGLFDVLPNLEEVVLDSNRLVALPSSIGTLTRLRILNCSNNELSALASEVSNLSSLKVLDLHDNNISVLPPEIWELSSLSTFNASSNLLKEFPRPITLQSRAGVSRTASATSDELFQPPLALCLQELYLGDNRLTDDVFSPVSLISELRVLNLSYNILDEIPAHTLSNLSNLAELYLSGNQLSTLPGEDVEKLRRLRILQLNGNRLQTLPAELGKLGQLHTLDVASNALKYNICNFPYDWNWNWNTGLRSLNLSGNKRLQIRHNLSENSASHLNLPDFANLRQLRVLGLMDVTLMLEAPVETPGRRVRLSLPPGRMRVGIADTLRKSDHGDSLWVWDKMVPCFRNKPDASLFALFDGHTSGSSTGARVARQLADSLEYQLADELDRAAQDESPVVTALRRTFLSLNKELGTESADETAKLGATGVVAYVVGTTLYVANAGDTVAVICRNAGTAHLISMRHTPWATEEIVRIRNNKGYISPQGLLNAELEVSRGFGHFSLLPLVNANPSIEEIELTENDEFVILGTRSMWDHMSYQTAVDVARMDLDNLMVAAQKVRDFAITYGADTSLAVMIIGVGDLFAEQDVPPIPKPDALGIPRAIEDPASVGVYKRNRWRNQGPGSSKLARLGSKNAEAPTGWVALVFTDIKNSTFLWETLPTAMRFAVKSHNLSMRRWLMSLGGYEVKTEGDAFRAAFPTVAAALLWCLTMQVQLLQLDWPQEILDCAECAEVFKPGLSNQLLFRGISVRMGIHWGTPVCEPDPVTQRMDYLGHMVKRSDSVCNFADGGQISVSRDVVNELERLEAQYPGTDATSLPRDVRMLRKIGYTLFDMGEIKLKGLEAPEHLSLVFPTSLAARFEFSQTAPLKQPAPKIVDPGMIRSLGYQSMRLERIVAGNAQSRRASRIDCLNGFITFDVKDQSSDQELVALLDSLISRIENAVSSLYLSQLVHTNTIDLTQDPAFQALPAASRDLLKGLLSKSPLPHLKFHI